MAKGNTFALIEQIAERHYKNTTKEKLKISFDYLEFTEKFFLQGLEQKYYTALFDTLRRVKNTTAEAIKKQYEESLEPKSIRWGNAKDISENSFPKEKLKNILTAIDNNGKNLTEEDTSNLLQEYVKDSFELSVSKNSGRIHGFIFSNVFHIVWIDPAHNLFPGRYPDGKLKKIRLINEYGNIKAFDVEEFNKLKKHNQELMQQLHKITMEYEDYLEQNTKPD